MTLWFSVVPYFSSIKTTKNQTMTTIELKDVIFDLEDIHIKNGFLNIPISKVEKETELPKRSIVKMITNSCDSKYDYFVCGNFISAKRDYVK